jgi:hypothetical protein
MRYYPKTAKGFKIDDDVAETLGLLEEWQDWDGEQYDSDFAYAFEDKWGVYPYRVITFEESRGGEISGLTGFDNGETYILFEDGEEGESWDALMETLDDGSIVLEEGKWSQLS